MILRFIRWSEVVNMYLGEFTAIFKNLGRQSESVALRGRCLTRKTRVQKYR